MNKNLIVLQEGCKECGAACLLSIIKYYKGNCSMNKLLELTNTSKEGTTFYNINQAANEIGLFSKGYKVDNVTELIKINTPMLCQFINNNYEHFVVVYKIKNNKFIIMDPAVGKRIISLDEFTKMWTGYIMIFEPIKKLPFIQDSSYLNKVIIEIILKNKSFVINILLFSIIFTIFSCIYAFYMEIVIDYILSTTISNLIAITIIFTIILIIKCLSNYLRNKLLIIMNQKIDCSLILNTFQKILLLPYNYYKNKTTGDIISRINDLTYLKNILNKIILTVFLDMIISITGAIILFTISKTMFNILIIIILTYIVLLFIFRPLTKKLTNINQENNALINSNLVESINGFETIKCLNIESIMYQKFEKLYCKSLNNVYLYDNINNLELFLKDLITMLGLLITNFIGFKLIMENKLSLGSLIAFNSLLVYFIDPIRNIIDLNKDYYYAKNALKRANNMFEVEPENLTDENKLNLDGNIVLNNLSYSISYKQKILNNLNLTILKSNKTLILGNSGSGKSTLLKILYKYYSIDRNHLFINNYDINDLTTKDIRKYISYISQNEVIFTDTIKNNIILDRKIDISKFYEVCKLTCIDEIVKDMFLGYDTKLEENGLNISGGQRQRIILARALLKESNIILIDEGLNEVDINLERKILKNIFEYYNDKIFIIVSHRLDNMDLYDQVIKLNNGTIIENLSRRQN